MTALYPCPCCGRLVHHSDPGSYSICPVCGWEDDLVQLRWPGGGGGANRVSLVEAQRSYAKRGVAKSAFVSKSLPTDSGPSVDPGFRPVDLEKDNFEKPWDVEGDWPEDRTRLYWWRPTFWRLL
ncbi:CPCC family cysteine-rich protein [Kribbella sp. DT2]|uniref:CPCC family cysteine-rich protein n=1 Tax=Kribbella sp. DT2 TaxID=3393427 RepID=UPI003CE6DA18